MGKASLPVPERDWRGAGQGAEMAFALKVQRQQECWLDQQCWSSERALERREGEGWCGMAEIRRYLPGKVGESWSRDEAFEPKALGLKGTEEEAECSWKGLRAGVCSRGNSLSIPEGTALHRQLLVLIDEFPSCIFYSSSSLSMLCGIIPAWSQGLQHLLLPSLL